MTLSSEVCPDHIRNDEILYLRGIIGFVGCHFNHHGLGTKGKIQGLLMQESQKDKTLKSK